MVHMTRKSQPFIVLVAGLLAISVGCASSRDPRMRELSGWTREDFHMARGKCSGERCEMSVRSSAARFDVVRSSRTYRRDEIPGWERPAAERVLGAIGQSIVRAAGGFTDAVAVTLGASRVAERGDTARALWCAHLYIGEQRIVKRDGSDEVEHTRPLASGLRCHVATPGDSTAPLWTLDSGIAPPRDSLARLYDSLAAVQAPALEPAPAITLVQAGAAESAFVVERHAASLMDLYAFERWFVRRADGTRVAVIELGIRSRLRLAPDVEPEARTALRLIAAVLAANAP